MGEPNQPEQQNNVAEDQAKRAKKAKAFFDRADEVANTGNWDFAIEMYTEGLRREPENLERGHKKLREVSLKRKVQGGKPAGLMERHKHRPSKDPVENLTNAAYLLAKDPGSDALMEMFLKSALEVGDSDVTRWIGEIMLDSQRKAKKPSKRYCVVLMEAMAQARHYDLAVQSCHLGLLAAPGDPALENRLGQYGAEYTLQKGQYGEEGDFTKGIKDKGKQRELLQKDMLVKDDDYLKRQIEEEEKQYLANPTVPGKINGYVDALLKFEEDGYENQAIDVLLKAFQDTKAYQFKMRVGDVKIRQMSRRYRKFREQGNADAATQAAREQLRFEIEEYRERASNYPTDLGIKYELGRRLFLAGLYDDAIAVLQQAQRDPRRFATVMNYLGQAFMRKQWWQEAVDTFEKVLDTDISEDRAKDVRYNLGHCHEQMGKLDKAEEQFSHVAQVDFNYKDIRRRLEALRKRSQDKPS